MPPRVLTRLVILLLVLLALSLAIPVAAAYLSPDRTVVETVGVVTARFRTSGQRGCPAARIVIHDCPARG